MLSLSVIINKLYWVTAADGSYPRRCPGCTSVEKHYFR